MQNKEFKTIDQQIQILKDRGLIISDELQARDYLLSNNYYNIINGYSKPFLESKDKYISGATFDEISKLYFFDKEMKQTLFNAILDVEHHLKSIFTYRFAEAHKNQRYPYLDIRSYDHQNSLSVAYIVSKLDRIIKVNKHYENNSINYYFKKYHDVPIWVLVDYLDFGDLYTLIECVPRSIQNKIAKDLTSFIKASNPNFDDHFPPATMLSLIKNIHEVRNLCAHNKRLIYFNCRSDATYYAPLHDKYKISNMDHRRNIFTTFISIQCFISRIEYANLNNSIRKRINILNKSLHSININEILALLGFPANWHKLPKLAQ